jgi:hypothetical protein
VEVVRIRRKVLFTLNEEVVKRKPSSKEKANLDSADIESAEDATNDMAVRYKYGKKYERACGSY